MQPQPVSPAAAMDQKAEHQQKGSNHTATFRALPPPEDIYATVASTLAQPIDAEQYYQCILQILPAHHATLQGWRQTKGGDNEWGPEDDPLWEDTWDGTMDTFLGGSSCMANHTKCTQFRPCKKIAFHRLCFLKTEY